MKVTDKTYVAINYRLTLDSGEEVDRSQEEAPLAFITGAGQIIPGLERELMGMEAGDSAKITVEPEDAYGPVNEELFHEIPRGQFPDGEEVREGMVFEAQGPRGPFTVSVKSVNDNDTVTVDLNHPLAGQRLNFEVRVMEVREASAAELASLSSGCGCGCGSESQSDCGPGCNCG